MDVQSGHIRRRTAITASLLACGFCLTAALPVVATTFDVTTTNDEVTANGQCSLREAIINANDNLATYPECGAAGEPGPAMDVINLPAGTYTLTIDGVDERCDGATPCTGTTDAYVPVVTFDASQGDLDITDDVTINGAGSDVTRIEWTPTSAGLPLEGDDDPLSGDRIFHVSTTSTATADIASVVIRGLTLANGEVAVIPTRATDVCVPDGPLPSATTYDGGNLNDYDIEVILPAVCGVMDEEGKLSADDTSIVIDQFRRMGGAIALGGGYATVHYDSTQEGLPPVVESGGEGSGFGVEYVTLDDVVVLNSWSGGDGGGIHSVVPATISRSKISGNTSAGGNGGGLYNEGNTIISDTLIGRVFDADTVAAHPELTYRNSGENGGAIFFTGAPQTTTTILRSAINGNYAIGGAGLAGREATFDLTNTTISSNEAKDLGAGIITSGEVYLQNVTVANNVATTPASSGGAGLNGFSNATFYLSNTLLSNNTLEYPDKPVRRDNCGIVGSNAEFVSQGYNLEDVDSCFLDQTGDQKNTAPLLLDLADNGGLTETHMIPHSAVSGGVNSPAIDAGDDSRCPNNDQRGSLRPVDADEDGTANCDIGAFELANFTPDLQIGNMVAPDEAFRGDNFTVTTTVFNNTAIPDSNVTLVTSALPAQVTFVSASYNAGAGSVNCGGLTCDIGDLDAMSSATVTLTLSATAVGDAKITVSVSGDNVDDNTANNTHSVTTTVLGVADLELTATANTSSVVVGNEVTVTFTVANLGADDATDVSLFGTMPVEASLVSATPDNGTTCAQTGADVLCELGDLAVAGPSINVVLVLRADLVGVDGSAVDVSATAAAKQSDPDESNNTVSASVTITNASSGDGGGFCAYHPDGKFDPVLPLLLLTGLIYLARRRRA